MLAKLLPERHNLYGNSLDFKLNIYKKKINFSKNEGGGEGHLDFFRSFIQFGSAILPLLVLQAGCPLYSCLCFITNAKVRNMKNTDRQFPLACLSSHPHPTVLVNQVDHLLPVHHLDVGSVNDLTSLKISNTA